MTSESDPNTKNNDTPDTEPSRFVMNRLKRIGREVQQEFDSSRRILSFGEYLSHFTNAPERFARSAPTYVRDMFLHYGSEPIERPWGTTTRFCLFDCPWEEPHERGREPTLVGHEQLQQEIFRALANFAREGRANRLVLMHGPNGSAKSTAAGCILRALEAYSRSEEGALYRFHWIFPARKSTRGSIGFGEGATTEELASFAHMVDEDIDARLVIEVRDHPLFLLPTAQRRELLDDLWKQAECNSSPPEWLLSGEMCHKNKLIFEALLSSYDGDIQQVLRHVQVERYFVSRRYRVGAITLGPEMSVDARERQITADRSLSALPTSLQATTLFETHGELIEAAGGVLEFSDILKRPMDTFRYLQLTLETGQVALGHQTVFTNVVMIGSSNDVHLDAFRQHPEYRSFRGRIELLRVGYLRSYLEEEKIYNAQIVPQLSKHVAPHTIRVAAEFAVMTRLLKPNADAYAEPLREILASLSVVEKLELYALGDAPRRLNSEAKKLLKANVGLVHDESSLSLEYEGRSGVSPRTMRTLILDAAQSGKYRCVSPFAVLECLEDLCKNRGEYPWLQRESEDGDYHAPDAWLVAVRQRLLARIEDDLRSASNLIDKASYGELFQRYILNVSAWVKGESMSNAVTGKDEPADEALMQHVESLLAVAVDAEEHRNGFIGSIAAWAIENPDGEATAVKVFPGSIEKLKTAAFSELREPFARLLRDLVSQLKHGGAGMDEAGRRGADAMLGELKVLGYAEDSAADAASALLRERYADIVV